MRLSAVSQHNGPSITCVCFTGPYFKTFVMSSLQFYFSFGPWTSHRLSSVDDPRGKKKKNLNKSLKAECFKIEERTPPHIFFHRRVHPTAWLEVEKDQKSFCNFTDEKRHLSLCTYSYFRWLKKREKWIQLMLWNDKREGNKKRDSDQFYLSK